MSIEGGAAPAPHESVNPYVIVSPALPPAVAEPAAPRVWTVFVVFLVAVVAIVASQIVGVLVLVTPLLSRGLPREQFQAELIKLLTSPAAFMALGSCSQAVIGLAALLPAWFSAEPMTARLRLAAPNVPAWSYPVFALGSIFPFAIGMGLALALTLILPPDPSVAALYSQMTWQIAIPFVLFIALAPGICEELLFRGYMQGRLLRVWPAWLAIGVTSVLFGLLHVAPHAVVFATVVGVWLGVLAWRTGSVWPGVVCHAFINGAWNIWNISRHLAGVEDDMPPVGGLIVVGVLGLGCFAASVWILAGVEEAETQPEQPAPPLAFPDPIVTTAAG